MKVVFAVSNEYLYPLLVTMVSAIKNSRHHHQYLVLVEESFLPENRMILKTFQEQLGVSIEVRVVTLNKEFLSFGRFPAIAWARIQHALTEPEPFLWLDSDLICLAGWDSILSQDHFENGELIAAVRDPNALNALGSENAARKLIGRNYINAGVVAFNSPMWQAGNLDANISFLLENWDDFSFDYGDQCALNWLSADRVKFLPDKFNRLVSSNRSAMKPTCISHYVGPDKPWLQGRDPLVPFSRAQATYEKYERALEVASSLTGNRSLAHLVNDRKRSRQQSRFSHIIGRFAFFLYWLWVDFRKSL